MIYLTRILLCFYLILFGSLAEAEVIKKSKFSKGEAELVAFPEVKSYIQEIGNQLIKVSEFPQMEVKFIILNSSVPNAWASPDGKIAISRGLLIHLKNESELAAILAHELGHQIAFLRQEHNKKQYPLFNGHLIDTFMNAQAMISMLFDSHSRQQEEFDADFDGIRLLSKAGYDLYASIETQLLIIKLLGHRHHVDWFAPFFSTHPSPSKRIQANLQTIGLYQNEGYIGKEKFQKVMTHLIDKVGVYSNLKKGFRALMDNDPHLALSFAEEAIQEIPNEPFFYGLKSQVFLHLGQEQKALNALDHALSLNDDFYEFHLQKGLILERIGFRDRAKKEYEISLELLPTPIAHTKLGEFDLREKRRESALRHLENAVDLEAWYRS